MYGYPQVPCGYRPPCQPVYNRCAPPPCCTPAPCQASAPPCAPDEAGSAGGPGVDSDGKVLFRGRSPTELKFGTSGLRGLVTDITDLEAYINSCGFLAYAIEMGDCQPGDTISIAGDLRVSTDSPDRSIMRAVNKAILDSGLKCVNYGKIPTPALTFGALQAGNTSIMITGSHIPFDRNGIKFNRKAGEVLKSDEKGILAAVARTREVEYTRPAEESLFADDGMFKEGVVPSLPEETDYAAKLYCQRNMDFFGSDALAGKRVAFFTHSAVGRDLLPQLFRDLGAEVHEVGRSDTFVAIDTEAITPDQLQSMQAFVDGIEVEHGPVDALVSTDGDSDRPLLCGVKNGRAQFFGGDLLGVVVAEFLGATAVAVPISANDAVDRHLVPKGVIPVKTKIGSPHVIKAMQSLQGSVVGWEANGGFLTGSTITRNGVELAPLPTRDAVLPLLCTLMAAVEGKCSIPDVFARLPPRFSNAGLLDNFPREKSAKLIKTLSCGDATVVEAAFEQVGVTVFREGSDGLVRADDALSARMMDVREAVLQQFTPEYGFGALERINYVDGVRCFFEGGDVAHIRPSGNAPQLRIYAVAPSQERANEIVAKGIEEPFGILRSFEASLE